MSYCFRKVWVLLYELSLWFEGGVGCLVFRVVWFGKKGEKNLGDRFLVCLLVWACVVFIF